jgi:DNA primase
MKYPKEYLDEIKLRLKVSQVIGKSVQLKKKVKSLLVFLLLKMKKAHHLQLMMKKNFTIVLAAANMAIYLTF